MYTNNVYVIPWKLFYDEKDRADLNKCQVWQTGKFRLIPFFIDYFHANDICMMSAHLNTYGK